MEKEAGLDTPNGKQRQQVGFHQKHNTNLKLIFLLMDKINIRLVFQKINMDIHIFIAILNVVVKLILKSENIFKH